MHVSYEFSLQQRGGNYIWFYRKQFFYIARLKRDGTRAEIRFRLSPKRTSPFKSAGASVQSTAGSRGVRISGSNAGYITFRGSVQVLATHSIRQFPLHLPFRASPCVIKFQTHYTTSTVPSDGGAVEIRGVIDK